MGDLIAWAADATRTLLFVLAAIAASGMVLLGWRLLRHRASPSIDAAARDLALAGAIALVVVLTLLSPIPVGVGREPDFLLVPFEDLRDALNGGQSLGVALAEMVGNVALFVPLGLSLRWRFPGVGVVQAGLIGCATSGTIEVLQGLTGGGRWPDTTDVITNTVGALLGAALAGIGTALSQRS